MSDPSRSLSFREALREKVVPSHRYSIWYYLGGLTLVAFGVQFVTGILLLYYFESSPGLATMSLSMIVRHVPFGWFVRSLHAWSASVAVLLAAAHMFAVYFLKAYRGQGRVLWTTGVPMIVIVLGFGYTGWQLPAAQGAALRLFYTLHVALLPLIATVLVLMHLAFSVTRGGSLPPGVAARSYRRWVPDYLLSEVTVWLVAFALMIFVAWMLPWEFNGSAYAPREALQLALPSNWYLLWQSGWIDSLPAVFYWLVILTIVALLLAIPKLDGRYEDRKKSKLFRVAGVAVLVALVAASALAYFSSANDFNTSSISHTQSGVTADTVATPK